MKKLQAFLFAALLLISASANAAFDGNGTFNRLYNWQADKAANINIRADRMDAEMDGFATGLSTCVTKDGQTQITHNLPMSGFRHTGVANAQSFNDYAAAGQVRDNTLCSGTSGGAANVYTLLRSIPGSSYITGTVVWLTPGVTNTTSSTLNLDNLGAVEIRKGSATALSGGELISGTTYPLYYNGSTFQVIGSQVAATPSIIVNGTTSEAANPNGISVTVAGAGQGNWTSAGLVVSGTVFSNVISATTVSTTNVSATNLTVGNNPILATGFQTVDVYDATNTWVPTVTQLVQIEAWGGGGGGGGVSSGISAAGGGAGGYCRSLLTVTKGVTLTITVGAGGTGGTSSGTNGTAGGTTSVVGASSAVSATGGGLGAGGTGVGSNQAGGAGGVCGVGTFKITGGDGSGAGTASGGTNANAGTGGNAPLGGPGGARGTTGVANASNLGGAGQTPGGGGGGAGFSATAGGNGGGGRVAITH